MAETLRRPAPIAAAASPAAAEHPAVAEPPAAPRLVPIAAVVTIMPPSR